MVNRFGGSVDLWEITEYVGETLVFIGVVGEVLAEWREPHRKNLGKLASIVLVIGLAVSLAALIGTNENFNERIAYLNAEAGLSNQAAGAAQRDAATAREQTAQLQKDTQGLKTEADDARRDMVQAQLELARLNGPLYHVPVIRGVATPDLSKGFTQQILLTGDIRINPPILPPMPRGGTASWTLFLDQDAVGSHQYTFEFERDIKAYPGLVPNSRASFEFVTDEHGRTTMRGLPIVDLPKAKTPK